MKAKKFQSIRCGIFKANFAFLQHFFKFLSVPSHCVTSNWSLTSIQIFCDSPICDSLVCLGLQITHTHTHIYIYIYIYANVPIEGLSRNYLVILNIFRISSVTLIRGAFISLQTFLYRHLKLSYTLENSPCYCYISYEMTDVKFKRTATAAIGIHADCYSGWISQMQSGREDTLEERYAIKYSFKLGKMPQKPMECFRLLLEHLAWIEHEFLSGRRDSRKAGSLWVMLRGVGGVRKSEHQCWLAKGLGLELLCWGFKGVQEEIPREEVNTLQIGSVAFPPGPYTSPQLHPCHGLFEQDGHQDSSSASL